MTDNHDGFRISGSLCRKATPPRQQQEEVKAWLEKMEMYREATVACLEERGSVGRS